MKHYFAYKKQFNTAFLFFALLLPLAFLHAQNASDIQNKIGQKNSDIQKLEQEIAGYQTQLDSLGQQKNSLNGSLKQLDLTKKKLNVDSAITQNKIDKTDLTIQNLSSDISVKEDVIKIDTDSIKLEIRNESEFDQESIVESLLSENDFTTAWNDLDNLAALRERLRIDIGKLQQIKGALEDTRNVTIDAKNQLSKLESELSDQKKIVAQNTDDKNNLLKQTKNSEANYQKLLKDRIAKRDAFEKELSDYEAQLRFIVDPTKLPPGRVLSWPLAKIFITQLFGKTADSKRLYASGTHSGVDFRASIGTPVMAMADGTVLGVGDTDTTCYGASFGKFVFIQYGNGLSSTFGHLSLIKANEGQKVKTGDVVGYSGATGHVTGPHLHVSLYASQAVKMATSASLACGGRISRIPAAPMNAYLDALTYLPPYAINTSILNNHPTE
jgi:murein DD-endopeptidase MepM/ murein hydrolase activator NlpD